jgi:hypothetical protein
VFEETVALYRSIGEPAGIRLALWGLGMVAVGEGRHRRAASLLEEALTLARKLGHVSKAAGCLADLGVVASHESDYGQAAALFEESLRLASQVDEELVIGDCLWGVAVVAAAQEQPGRAVRLWGAATILGYALSLPSDAVHPLEERLLLPAKKDAWSRRVRRRVDQRSGNAAGRCHRRCAGSQHNHDGVKVALPTGRIAGDGCAQGRATEPVTAAPTVSCEL